VKKTKKSGGSLQGLKEVGKRGEFVFDQDAFKKKMDEIQKDEEDKKHRRGKYASPKGVCAVCGGEVIEKISSKYYGDPMHMIIGPGSASQMTTVHHGWHCTSCGIKYEFLPKRKSKI